MSLDKVHSKALRLLIDGCGYPFIDDWFTPTKILVGAGGDAIEDDAIASSLSLSLSLVVVKKMV